MNITEKLRHGITTSSATETEAIGIALAEIIPLDHAIKLYGDLGVGKTTFVRGLAQFWEIKETVTSPTFNIFSIYQGKRNLVHLDAYRLENASESESLMLEDFLESPFCLAIEWPEKWLSPSIYPCWHLQFSILPDQKHYIRWIEK